MNETVLHYGFKTYDPKLFGDRLTEIMIENGYVDKKGQLDYRRLHNQLCDKEDKISETSTGQYVIDRTRKEREWTNGKHAPRTIEDIIKLCNIFHVDIQYFFCADLEYKTVNNEYICNETGLTEKALQTILALKEKSCFSGINHFLSESYMLSHIFQDLEYAKERQQKINELDKQDRFDTNIENELGMLLWRIDKSFQDFIDMYIKN